MPRTARASAGGICYHAINRGNGGAQVFQDDRDYHTFVDLLEQANDHTPMRLVGFCLMPNHIHLVLWPRHDGDLSRYMQWLLTSHVRRHHRRYGTSGHVWQGRFKAFPIQADDHLLTVLRYVERNPFRANLVPQAQEWTWSSLSMRRAGQAAFLNDGPVDRPRNWLRCVNQPETDDELTALRHSIHRGTPFGRRTWVARIAKRLGLESTLNPRGRPRSEQKK
ncbi:MAG: transposase [Phycisphaerae bacterium]